MRHHFAIPQIGLVAAVIAAAPARAQNPPADTTSARPRTGAPDSIATTDSARAVAATPPQPIARPAITVQAFEYSTVVAQIDHDKRTRQVAVRMGGAANVAAALGAGAADMIVEHLVASGGFRVLERKALDAVRQEQQFAAADSGAADAAVRMAAARYVVTGSVTRLGVTSGWVGGVAGQLASGIYGLGAKTPTTEVHLTARIVDSRTGEIVASVTGEGVSRKGFSLVILGIGGPRFGGGGAGSDDFRESAIGEATSRAAAQVVERIVQRRSALATP